MTGSHFKNTRTLVAAVMALGVTFALFLFMDKLILSGSGNRAELDAIAGIHFGPVEIPDEITTKSRRIPKKPPPPKNPPTAPRMKIAKVEQPVQNLPQMNIPQLDIPLVGGEGMFIGNFQQVDKTAEGDIIPVVVIRPMYPREAAIAGIEGWVKVEFTITPLGTVKDASVVDANPSRIFNREAIRAILKWKFKPRVVDGTAVERRATQIIDFSLRDQRDDAVIFTLRHLFAKLALGACVAAYGMGAVWAQTPGCGKERKVGGKALDEVTWKQLNSVYEDVSEEKYDRAYAVLQKMLGRAGRDNYLRAIINQALAQVEWSREHYDEALAYFERAVELDALPDQAHFALMYQIAQLYFMKERYLDALGRLDLWFCTAPGEKITATAYALKASIYAQMKDYRQTLQAIDTAIGMESMPMEPWYQLKLASHYELEQYPQAAATLEVMITHWPDKKLYWTQLAQTYFNLKQDDKALAVAALAYRKQLLTSQADITYLSNLYANADVPYKAGAVLQKGIEDGVVASSEKYWTAVADHWYSAEEMEKALMAYEKAGAEASGGDIDLRRAYILVDLERWLVAKEALDAAITKGGLDELETGQAYLLRGMAEFNLGNYDQASGDWGRASRYPRSRASAQQWINHLQEERKRSAS